MAQAAEATTRNQAINIRASRQQRELIDRAARVLGKTRSEFMLETICRQAEDVLIDRAFLQLDDDEYTRFSAMLDAPAAPSDELRNLLRRKAPWE